jgi:hypothetical protein
VTMYLTKNAVADHNRLWLRGWASGLAKTGPLRMNAALLCACFLCYGFGPTTILSKPSGSSGSISQENAICGTRAEKAARTGLLPASAIDRARIVMPSGLALSAKIGASYSLAAEGIGFGASAVQPPTISPRWISFAKAEASPSPGWYSTSAVPFVLESIRNPASLRLSKILCLGTSPNRKMPIRCSACFCLSRDASISLCNSAVRVSAVAARSCNSAFLASATSWSCFDTCVTKEANSTSTPTPIATIVPPMTPRLGSLWCTHIASHNSGPSSINRPTNTTTPPISTRCWNQSCFTSNDFSFALLIGPLINRKYHGKNIPGVTGLITLALGLLIWFLVTRLV